MHLMFMAATSVITSVEDRLSLAESHIARDVHGGQLDHQIPEERTDGNC